MLNDSLVNLFNPQPLFHKTVIDNEHILEMSSDPNAQIGNGVHPDIRLINCDIE